MDGNGRDMAKVLKAKRAKLSNEAAGRVSKQLATGIYAAITGDWAHTPAMRTPRCGESSVAVVVLDAHKIAQLLGNSERVPVTIVVEGDETDE